MSYRCETCGLVKGHDDSKHNPEFVAACTCPHNILLHKAVGGCVVGWQGKGEPVDGAENVRHFPAGCTCTAKGTFA
jgi:hypothetical protein